MVGKQKAFSGEKKKILLPQRGSSTSCERFQAVQKENPYLCLYKHSSQALDDKLESNPSFHKDRPDPGGTSQSLMEMLLIDQPLIRQSLSRSRLGCSRYTTPLTLYQYQ